MAYTQQRKGIWYACWVEPGGRERKRSTKLGGEEGRQLAERLCKKVEAELYLGVYEANIRAVPWKYFLKEYYQKVILELNMENGEIHWRAVQRFAKEAVSGSIAHVSYKDIGAFVRARKQDKGKHDQFVSPATINKDLAYIKSMFKTAYEWGYLRKMPKVKMLRVPKKIEPFVNPEEFTAIYRACPNNWWRAFLLFQFMTGWRVGQALKLRWYSVDLENGDILSDHHDNKGKRDVLIPLHDVLRTVLAILREEKQTDFVFPFKGHITGLYKPFEEIQTKAGIKPRHKKEGSRYTYHDLRRGFATANAEHLDIFELQKLMMHRDLRTTMKYVNMAHRLRPAIEKIHVPDLE